MNLCLYHKFLPDRRRQFSSQIFVTSGVLHRVPTKSRNDFIILLAFAALRGLTFIHLMN